MTTFSKSDLATRILRDAGLVGADETPSAIDLEFAEETLSSEIDALAIRGISIWNGSETEIPNGYLTTLSRRIVLAIAPAFGLASAAEVEVAIPKVEATLRALSHTPSTGAYAQADYF